MVELTTPALLDESFARMLQSTKRNFVTEHEDGVTIAQHGMARIDADGWPGWPELSGDHGATEPVIETYVATAGGIASTSDNEPVIETYVATAGGVASTSDNEPYVSSWLPLVTWMDTAVRTALAEYRVELDGDAYATASLTRTAALEGVAHMDDDTFVPAESVSVVAIIGQLVGPRVATGQLEVPALRPMSQVVWSEQQLGDFEADQVDHCASEPDALVLFPQFGQLHAGPSAAATEHLAPHRQLLVFRAKVALPQP